MFYEIPATGYSFNVNERGGNPFFKAEWTVKTCVNMVINETRNTHFFVGKTGVGYVFE